MPRAPPVRSPLRRPRASARPSTLDARAVEAVGRFVRVLARCGYTPEDIAQEVTRACQGVPKSWAAKAQVAIRELDDAAHVLTLWFSDPAWLDARGRPRPLPLRGAAGSIEALMRRVDPSFEARELVRYLSHGGALRRVGRRYVPRDRMLSLRGARGPDNFHHLRGLLGMLRTLEHNTQPKRRVPGWFEAIVENRYVPLGARSGFDKRLRDRLMQLLSDMDADMHRRERSRRPGERTVRLGVGVYRFEERSPPENAAAPRGKTQR